MQGSPGDRSNAASAWLLAAVALTGLIALALLAAGAPPAHAAAARTKILFDRRVGEPNDYNVLSMRPNGSHQHALTHNPDDDWGASASPNGKRIVFVSEREPSGGPGSHDDKIFIMRSDGSHERQLTHTPSGVYNEYPSFTPNGRKIVFDSDLDGDGEIFIMRADGTHRRQLTHNNDNDYGAVPSPNGKKIAFNSNRDGDQEIFIMRANGSHQHQITHNTSEDELPAYFPSGRKLAFESDRDGDREIFTMKVNGARQRQLTHNTTGDDSASVSPNGRKIAFDSDRDGDDEIFTMKANGSHQRQLTHNSKIDEYPHWARLR